MGHHQTDVRHWSSLLPPSEAPSLQDDEWRHFDKSVNAISFGFVATAILIAMFLVMAIFERFLMTTTTSSPPLPPPSSAGGAAGDVESQMGFDSKHAHPSHKASENAREVSVLMPGEEIPTFIAQPAPVMYQSERPKWLTEQRFSFPKLISNSHSEAS